MRRLRRTKIVATLGPASSDRDTIARLFEAGADVFRINMSHTSHERMRELVTTIRSIEADHEPPDRHPGRFAGSEAAARQICRRIGDAEQGRDLHAWMPTNPPVTHAASTCRIAEIFGAVEPGHALLLDDGKVRLQVREATTTSITTSVEVGGKLSDRKGVSLPDATLPFSALAPKDRSDLEAALDAGIDWLALSFIQRPEDIAEAKKLTRGRASVMAKIEKPQAMNRLGEILELADAVMVARGDLGVELPLEKVPGSQKKMTRMARRAGKPVVVATQMLESMINSPVPTRAEVSDVATAIYEGADAVMLSAESAAGQYPVEAVAMMNRIAEEVENDEFYRSIIDAQHAAPEATGADAIADAARQIAGTLELSALVCWTASGATGLRVARERPKPPIVAISPNISTGRRLSLVWGSPLRRGAGRARPGRHGGPRLPHCVSRKVSPNPANASSSSPACRWERRARPICCALPSSAPRATPKSSAWERRLPWASRR